MFEANTPEYWVEQGFVRNWGDCAIMSPELEILRRTTDYEGIPCDFRTHAYCPYEKVEYLLIGSALRGGYAIIYAAYSPQHAVPNSSFMFPQLESWGAY